MKKVDESSAGDSSTLSSSASADHHHHPQEEQGLQSPSTNMSSSISACDSSTTITTRATLLSPCEEDVSKNKARQFVERVIRLQIETCYGGKAGGGEAGEAGGEGASSSKQQKDAFLHFVRILQKHLQQKDLVTHLKVKAALQECAAHRKAEATAVAVVGYETVAASMASTLICLQQIVRPAHWKRTVDYMKQQYANNNNNNNSDNSNTFVWSLIESIAMDDMIFFTQRLMEKQNEFRAIAASTAPAASSARDKENGQEQEDNHHQHLLHHPLYVDIGVHYTKYSNLDRIQVNGLLSRNERGKIGILAERFNGDVHGNGIYTGNNPYAYSDFGDVGILVARLKGNVSFRSSSGKGKGGGAADAATLKPKSTCSTATSSSAISGPGQEDTYNSIVVGNGYSQMVVLGDSSQCIPLLHFPRSMIDKHKAHHHHDTNSNIGNTLSSSSSAAGSCAILYYQEELQKIVDEFFNKGIIPRNSPPLSSQPRASSTTGNSSLQHRMDTTQATTTMASTTMATTVKNVVYQILYMIAFMAIVGTIVSMSVSLCLFLVKTMSSLSSSRFMEL